MIIKGCHNDRELVFVSEMNVSESFIRVHTVGEQMELLALDSSVSMVARHT